MKTWSLRIFYIGFLSLLLAGCGGGHDSPYVAFSSVLTGREVVPAVAGNGFADAVATVDTNSMTLLATVVVSGVAATDVHLHIGRVGTVAPPAFGFGNVPGTALWTLNIPLTQAQMDALWNGDVYIDVHSAAAPAGEIRGQLLDFFPSFEQVDALARVRQQSPLVEEQLRQLRDIEEEEEDGWRFGGVGFTVGF